MGVKYAPLLVIAAVLWMSAVARSADEPEQFKVWGKAAGEQAPLPAGWEEAPPPSDDLKPPEGWPSKDDAARGFALFSRNPMDLIYPGSFPRPDDLPGELRAFTFLGEYVPLTLGVRALKELKAVTLSVGSLAGPGGVELAANQFDVRVVRCHRVPSTKSAKSFYWLPASLEKPEVTDIPDGRAQAFWVTAFIAPDVKPGEYKGKAALKSGDAVLAEVPVRLKVLPLRLKRPPQTYVMWQNSPTEDEALYLKIERDLWDHGINTSWPAWSGHVGTRDAANKTRALPEDALAPMRAGTERRADLWKKTAFAKHPRPSYGSPDLHWVIENWDSQKGWMTPWPINEHIDANVCTLIKMIEDVRKQKGLPEILYYLYDEAGGHPETFPFALHYYKLLKEKFPELKTFTDIGGGLSMGIDEIAQLAPVIDVLCSNRISEKIIKDIRDRKREFQIYNGGSMVLRSPAKDRLFFGFYGWKTTATGIGQWVHWRGKVGSAAFRNPDDHGYVGPSADGPVPTIHWEALRGGIDDMRYTVTLYDLILQAKKAGKPEALKEAEAAEASLAEIESMIPIPKEEVGNHAEAAASLSPRIYDKWRWRVAQHVLKLNELLGLGEGKEGDVSFPAREYKYSAAAAGPKLSETEMLAGSGFENGMEPFSVQPWSGKGSGGLDTAQAHAGKSSVAMTNTSAANDVLVCVWYQPKLELKVGKTYRFSGWIKTEGVSMGVKVRIAAQRQVESAAVSGDSAWKQIACDYTPTQDEAPKYLAVWLQGPGKAFVDDLSLRELLVEKIPLRAAIDADRYDESDASARVVFHVDLPAEKAANATIALRALAGGKEAYAGSVPAKNGKVVAIVPLANLPKAAIEIVGELKDADGVVLGQAKTYFSKAAGPFAQ